MPRIEIRHLDDKTLQKLDEQRHKYGNKSRADYIKFLIELDSIANIAAAKDSGQCTPLCIA